MSGARSRTPRADLPSSSPGRLITESALATMHEPVDSQYFRHPAALVESADVGPRTRVWAFAHILPGARVGADCNVCDGVFIEGGAVVGDRVTVKCGVQLWNGVTLEDDVFVGPNATFTNDPWPR